MNSSLPPQTTPGLHSLTARGQSAAESQTGAGPASPCTNSKAGERNARGWDVLGYHRPGAKNLGKEHGGKIHPRGREGRLFHPHPHSCPSIELSISHEVRMMPVN